MQRGGISVSVYLEYIVNYSHIACKTAVFIASALEIPQSCSQPSIWFWLTLWILMTNEPDRKGACPLVTNVRAAILVQYTFYISWYRSSEYSEKTTHRYGLSLLSSWSEQILAFLLSYCVQYRVILENDISIIYPAVDSEVSVTVLKIGQS